MQSTARFPGINAILPFLFVLLLHPFSLSVQALNVNNHTKSGPLPTLDEIISTSLSKSLFPGPNGVPSKYVLDMQRVAGPVDSWLDLMCAAGDVQGCPARNNFPGPESRSPVRWAAVSRLVALLPYKQWSGRWWRGSETSSTITTPMYHTHPDTGEAILNPMSLGLGMLPSQHVVIRPILEAAFTHEKKTSKERSEIEAYAERILNNMLNDSKKKGKLVKMDVQIWFQKTINMIVFGRQVSTEYVEEFYKSISGLGKTFVSSNAVPRKYWPRDLLGMNGFRRVTFRYAEEFKPLIRKRYGHLLKGKDCSPSRSCLDQAAHALLEPMRSLAIPNSIYIGMYGGKVLGAFCFSDGKQWESVETRGVIRPVDTKCDDCNGYN